MVHKLCTHGWGGGLSLDDYSETWIWGKYTRNFFHVHKLEKNKLIFPECLVCYGVPGYAITPILDWGKGGVSRGPWKWLYNLWTVPKVRWLCGQISNFVIWISPRKWCNSPSHSPPSTTLALTRWHLSLKSKHPLFRIWFELYIFAENAFSAFLSFVWGLLSYCDTGDDKWGSEWCKSIRHQVHHNVFLGCFFKFLLNLYIYRVSQKMY